MDTSVAWNRLMRARVAVMFGAALLFAVHPVQAASTTLTFDDLTPFAACTVADPDSPCQFAVGFAEDFGGFDWGDVRSTVPRYVGLYTIKPTFFFDLIGPPPGAFDATPVAVTNYGGGDVDIRWVDPSGLAVELDQASFTKAFAGSGTIRVSPLTSTGAVMLDSSGVEIVTIVNIQQGSVTTKAFDFDGAYGFRFRGGGDVWLMDNVTITPVPEPSAGVLAALGLLAVAAARRRRG